MTTANASKQPATPLLEHDLTAASYSPHASDFGSPNLVFDSRCRRCWYDRALADLAPLHRQLVGALTALTSVTEELWLTEESSAEHGGTLEAANNAAHAALDAARKVGWA